MSAFVDRLTGRPIDELPDVVLSGRYAVANRDKLVVQGFRPAIGDVLLAGTDGRVTITRGASSCSYLVVPAGAFSALDEAALAAAADAFASCSAELLDAVAATPLVARPTPESFRPQHLDLAIERDAPSVAQACFVPHTKLDTVVELTPVSRARRLAPAAVSHLSAHSEEWRRRRVSSVVPNRVLAQRVDVRLDVYENRVLARLIDDVLRHLSKRLHETAQLTRLYRDALDFSTALTAQHALARRLSELWGEGFGAAVELDEIEQLSGRLRRQQRRIQGLTASSTYRAIPRRTTIDRVLKSTNVFENHQHYRRVAALWQTLRDRAPEASRAEHYAAEQLVASNFHTYCWILTLRALQRLGATSAADAPPGAEAVSLDVLGATVIASRDPSGCITLKRDESALAMVVVPIAAALTQPAEADAPAVLTAAFARASRMNHSVVVAYPGTREDVRARPQDAWDTLNGESAGLPNQGALIPVSAFDLLSLERLERALRRWFLVELFSRYPAQVSCQRAIRDSASTLSPFLSVSASADHISVSAPIVGDVAARLDRAVTKEVSKLRPRVDDARRQAWAALRGALAETSLYFDALETCPNCRQRGSLTPRGDGHFLVACKFCESTWGLGACGNCESRIPFVRVGASASGVRSGRDLDVQCGRDVLALPCRHTGDGITCVNCGWCPDCGPSGCD